MRNSHLPGTTGTTHACYQQKLTLTSVGRIPSPTSIKSLIIFSMVDHNFSDKLSEIIHPEFGPCVYIWLLKSVKITRMYTSEYVPSKMGCKLRWDGNQKLSAVMINFIFLEIFNFENFRSISKFRSRWPI